MTNKKELIRIIYLYLFSLIGLVLIIIGSVRIVNLALKTYVFTKADNFYTYPRFKPIPKPDNSQDYQEPDPEKVAEYEKNQQAARRQREAANSLAFIVIGLPVYLYHWRLVVKDNHKRDQGLKG